MSTNQLQDMIDGLHETLDGLTPDERLGLADMIERTLAALPPSGEALDAGLRQSFEVAAKQLRSTEH